MIRGRPRWRFRASGGGFDLNLPAEERELLRDLPANLVLALDDVESTGAVPDQLNRLFPAANPRDESAEARYVAEHRAPLLDRHRDALNRLTETADARHLSQEEMAQWLDALNSIRLVLGTSLEVTEDSADPDPADPRYADWICYHYLSYLTGEVVELLTGQLPPPTAGADDDLPEDPWGEPLGGLRWDGTPVPDEGQTPMQ